MFSNSGAYFHDNLHSNQFVMPSKEFQKITGKNKMTKDFEDAELQVQHGRTTPQQRH
jgi:hypothetical protein